MWAPFSKDKLPHIFASESRQGILTESTRSVTKVRTDFRTLHPLIVFVECRIGIVLLLLRVMLIVVRLVGYMSVILLPDHLVRYKLSWKNNVNGCLWRRLVCRSLLYSLERTVAQSGGSREVKHTFKKHEQKSKATENPVVCGGED